MEESRFKKTIKGLKRNELEDLITASYQWFRPLQMILDVRQSLVDIKVDKDIEKAKLTITEALDLNEHISWRESHYYSFVIFFIHEYFLNIMEQSENESYNKELFEHIIKKIKIIRDFIQEPEYLEMDLEKMIDYYNSKYAIPGEYIEVCD